MVIGAYKKIKAMVILWYRFSVTRRICIRLPFKNDAADQESAAVGSTYILYGGFVFNCIRTLLCLGEYIFIKSHVIRK